ncbi:hypothetical protein WJX75_003978 [Coccomyxa subellipsoidea]|uniref:Nucleic acid-binding protein n=1 Tax=Coccomyxa subellipsoidea TaxID=248742 RepID=A0ABR2YVD5_9CHLO
MTEEVEAAALHPADGQHSVVKGSAAGGNQADVAAASDEAAEQHVNKDSVGVELPSSAANGGHESKTTENGVSAEAATLEDPHEGGREGSRHEKKDIDASKNETTDGKKHEREKKDREKDRSREKDRPRDREKDRKDRHRDSDRKDSKRDKDDRKERKRSVERDRDSSRKRRERSPAREKDREKSKRSHSDRKSSRHRSKSRERRRSRSMDKRSRHRSKSRDRSRRSRRRDSSSSDDEFGGYVPRKRQEAPQQAGYSTSYVDPYASLRSSTLTSTDPQEIARQMQEQQLKARQLVLQQQAASAVAAASKTQREVYVGNLVAGLVTEDALRQLFNSTMAAAFPNLLAQGLEAVVSVSMHSEGRYAFVELRTPEMASAALQLSNQVQLLGQSISVGRPSGYVDPSRAQLAASAAAAALSAFQAGDMQAMEYQLQQANLTVPGLNAPSMASPAAAAAAASPATLPLPPPPPLAQAQAPVNMAASVEPGAPTQYLQVTGMVTPDVLVDDEEYNEVIQDLQEECSKYGRVLRVLVPRPPNPAASKELFGSNNYGKAFTEFADVSGCSAAKAAIHGRLFAGETVQATYEFPPFFNQKSDGNEFRMLSDADASLQHATYQGYETSKYFSVGFVERAHEQGSFTASPAQEAEPKKKEKGQANTPKKEIIATVDMLDIRVGQVVKVDRHPDADSLYVEEIDIGEEQPRQIVSGLVAFVPVEEMLGRRVLVLANLKPAKLRGILSSGMVLCASNDAHDKVEPCLVPEGVEIGERVVFEGFEGAPEPVLNPKKKLWEKIAPELTTNADGVAVYKDIPFMTSNGPITSSLANAKVR